MKDKTPKNGDIFRLKLTEKEYAFGRVLLNIESVLERGLTEPGHIFRTFKGSRVILAGFYKETSSGDLPPSRSVLIPNIFTTYGFLVMGIWDIVGHEKVDPVEVSFPESLALDSPGSAFFTKGEISIPFKLEMSELNKINISLTTFPPSGFENFLLYHMGRKNEITNPRITDKEVLNTKKFDLRFSEHRHKIYELAGVDPNESYYNFSKRLGFDLARFYR